MFSLPLDQQGVPLGAGFLDLQAVMHVPWWAGGWVGREACSHGWTWGQGRTKCHSDLPLCALQSDHWDFRFTLNEVSRASYAPCAHIFNYRLNPPSCQWTSWKLSIEYVLLLVKIELWCGTALFSLPPSVSKHWTGGERRHRPNGFIDSFRRWFPCIHICQFIWHTYF